MTDMADHVTLSHRKTLPFHALALDQDAGAG